MRLQIKVSPRKLQEMTHVPNGDMKDQGLMTSNQNSPEPSSSGSKPHSGEMNIPRLELNRPDRNIIVIQDEKGLDIPIYNNSPIQHASSLTLQNEIHEMVNKKGHFPDNAR